MKVQNQDTWQQLPTQQNMQGEAAAPASTTATPPATPPSLEERMYGKQENDTPTDTDTDTGTPAADEVLGAEEETDPAATETDESELDTDTGTPEEEEEEEGGYEKRFKDTQAKLTETAQELSRVRAEYAEEGAALQALEFEYQDKMEQQGRIANYLAQKAFGRVQQLQMINPSTLNQQQYAQWQQELGATQQIAQQTQADLQRIEAEVKDAKAKSVAREIAISKKYLNNAIPDFAQVYPEICSFMVSQGVSQKVALETTDPGVIKMAHQLMSLLKQPDVIKTTVTQARTTGVAPARNARSRTGTPQPKTLEQKLYGVKT
jgi:hypothetical protein